MRMRCDACGCPWTIGGLGRHQAAEAERDRLRALAITAVRQLNAYNCVLCGYYGNDPDTRDHKPDCPVKLLTAALSNPTATTPEGQDWDSEEDAAYDSYPTATTEEP